MKAEGFIDNRQFEEALQTRLEIQPNKKPYPYKAHYFLEYIRQTIERKYGRHSLYRGGLRIYTTVDLTMQMAAKNAIQKGLEELEMREGFRGPTGRVLFGEGGSYQQMIERVNKNPLEIGAITEGIVTKVD
ncbi:unnamed protein product, partial [marine sediment metagenome]